MGGLWRHVPTSTERIYPGGSYFDWIEMADDSTFEAIRNRIETLWSRLPLPLRAEHAARLRSKRSTDFFSCYCEMWYQYAMEAHGLTCTPAAYTESGTLPDWTISDDDRLIAVAECNLRMPPETDIRNNLVQHEWFRATFRKLLDKRIRLHVHERECGKEQPSADALAKYLDALAQHSCIRDNDTTCEVGRFQYGEKRSGWRLDFTIFLLPAPSADPNAQLFMSGASGAYWCRGTELFEKAITRKSQQHLTTDPLVICIGWNYFEHSPSYGEMSVVIARRAKSLERRNVCAIFWSEHVYPWNANPPSPRLIHWGSASVTPLLACWRGEVMDARDLTN